MPDPRGSAGTDPARGDGKYLGGERRIDTASRTSSQALTVVASNWRPRQNNTLLGFFDVKLPSGLVLHDLTLHEQAGDRSVSLPGKPQLNADLTVRRDPGGKLLYAPIVGIPDRGARGRFQAAALAALDRHLGSVG